MGNGTPTPQQTPAAAPTPQDSTGLADAGSATQQPTPLPGPTGRPPLQLGSIPPKQPPALTGIHDADNDFNQRQAEQTQAVKNIGYINGLPPDQRAAAMQKFGLTPDGFQQQYEQIKGQLKSQQAAAHAQGQQAEATAGEATTAANVAEDTGDLMTMAALVLGTAETGGLTLPLLTARVGEAYLINKAAHAGGQFGSEELDKLTSYVFPNAGKNAHLAARVTGSLVGGLIAGGATQGGFEVAEKSAAAELLKPPVGIKSTEDPTQLANKTEELNAVNEKLQANAKTKEEIAAQAQAPEKAPGEPAGGEDGGGTGDGGKEGPPEKPPAEPAPEGPEAAKPAAPAKEPEEQEWVKVGDNLYVPKPKEGEAAKPEDTALSADITQQRRLTLSKTLNLHENEDFVNNLRDRDPATPLSKDEVGDLQTARRQSSANVYKISRAYMDAMGVGNIQKMEDLEYLANGEYAKFLHMEGAEGDTPLKLSRSIADQTTALARQGLQTADLMRAVSTIEAKGRPDRISRLLSDSIGGLDVYKAAVNAQMLNPQIPIEKGLTDMIWLPYNATVDALGHIPQQGLATAGRLWLTSMRGYFGGFKDAMGYAVKSFKSGAPEFLQSLGPKAEENVFGDEFQNTTPGKAANFLGSVFASGSRAVMSADQFAKAIAYRMNYRTNALERGLQEADSVGITGGARWKYAENLAENYINEGAEWLQRATMSDVAKQTFTNDRPGVTAFQNWMSMLTTPQMGFVPEIPVGKMMALFVRTPINMIEAGLYNSPISPITPGSGFIRSMMEGGTARNQALAHWVTGSVITGLVWHEAMKGNITGAGPVNKTTLAAAQAQGWQPYSIRVGDTFISYRHLGPLYTMLSTVATFSERYHEIPTDGQGKVIWSAISAVASLVHNAPFMYQMGSLLNGLDEAAQHGQFNDLKSILTSIPTEMVPHPVEVAAKIMHPEMTDPQGILDRLKEESPWNRGDVPVKRDMFGQHMYVPPGVQANDLPPNKLQVAIQALNPLHYSNIKPDLVDHEIVRTGANIPNWPDEFIGRAPSQSMFSDPNDPRVGVPFSADPVKNVQLKDRLSVLAGNELKVHGMNMHDFMEDRINTPQYQNATKWVQAHNLERIHTQFTERAKMELMKEHPELKLDVVRRAAERRATIRGTSGTGGGTLGAP